jgi:hypothetical protein
VSGVDSVELLRRAADARGSDRCAIVYSASGRYGEFEVVVTDSGGSRRSVARSPAFRATRFRRPRRPGAARVAHELLVRRLEACGWWPADSGGPWHELGFVRPSTSGLRTVRSLVTVVRQAGQARFLAEELDSYGKPTPLVLSDPFRALRFVRVRPSAQAKTALEELVRRMESDGWRVAAADGKKWYAISLWRSMDGSPGAPSSPARSDARSSVPPT